MRKDLFFEKPGEAAYADIRYSKCFDACVIRIGDAPPELVTGSDDFEWIVSQRVDELEQQGFRPASKPTMPGVQTPAVIEAITGLAVPARYAAFLAAGGHPNGTVNGITNFADGIPIVFDDPIIPFQLKRSGRTEYAPNAIPIAFVEETRTLSIDATTGAIYVYDDSASEPHVHCYDSLGKLLANVTTATKKPMTKKKPAKKKPAKKKPAKKKPAKKPAPTKKPAPKRPATKKAKR